MDNVIPGADINVKSAVKGKTRLSGLEVPL